MGHKEKRAGARRSQREMSNNKWRLQRRSRHPRRQGEAMSRWLVRVLWKNAFPATKASMVNDHSKADMGAGRVMWGLESGQEECEPGGVPLRDAKQWSSDRSPGHWCEERGALQVGRSTPQ
ncbi:hypothetical protein JRQ81_001738 [Phrynocephalus forsythii]|uniref:Uncharacterized protein n=1 Tax=Phrynocephalus forsythii TaxID=171643 RepID=A0A9Q0Y8Q6_9SAUR|nr:hypothetical protein JRQ81_001738 [Phrynocephalus forsythii]